MDPYQEIVNAAASTGIVDTETAGLDELFDDLTLFQTREYGQVRRGERRVEEVVVRRADTIIGAARVWVVKAPVLNAGIAFVKRGPLWQRKGHKPDPEDYREIVRELYDQYVRHRGLMLRILPVQPGDSGSKLGEILEEEGFKSKPVNGFQTVVADLSKPMDEIWNLLGTKWRNSIRRAEKDGLTVRTGNGEELWQIFVSLYEEMLARKQFHDEEDVAVLADVQAAMKPLHKMEIMVCEYQSTPVAAIVVSAIGQTGIYIHGATSDEGLKFRGNNLLHWAAMNWLKKRGCCWYDLNGVDPIENPGGFNFKWRMIQRFGHHSTFRTYEACESLASASMIRFAESAKRYRHRLTGYRKRLRKPK